MVGGLQGGMRDGGGASRGDEGWWVSGGLQGGMRGGGYQGLQGGMRGGGGASRGDEGWWGGFKGG